MYRSRFYNKNGVRCSVVDWGTLLQARRSRVPLPMRSFDFSIDPILLAATMALGSTQPLPEMSIMNLPEGEGRRARKADNLIAICEPIV
jgi:hypothetical protein